MIRHTRLKFTLTLTRPCQFARLALPAFKAERIRGIFLIPPSWLCIIFEMSRFSELVKHSTALWRAFMTSRDSEGRRSHVRRSERPSVVLVLSSVPDVYRQPKCSNTWGWNADRIVIIPPWFSLSESTHGFRFRILARNSWHTVMNELHAKETEKKFSQ
jgi:hypothetical protein